MSELNWLDKAGTSSNCRIESGEDFNRDDPSTFLIPTLTERVGVKVGDFVELILTPDLLDEGVSQVMWVEVTRRQGNVVHYGVLSEDADWCPALSRGRRICFKPEHVIGIATRDELQFPLKPRFMAWLVLPPEQLQVHEVPSCAKPQRGRRRRATGT